MPSWDYKCPICGWDTTVARPTDRRDDPVYCPMPSCDFKTEMTRLPSAPNFVVNGFNARNGYTK